jgi:YARHG domain
MRLLPILRVMGVAGLVIAAAVAAMVLQPSRASANCYELIGCTNKNYFKPAQLKQLSCYNLWTVRNTIYKENGYCFKTKTAINEFGNAGCIYHDMGAVPLNAYERANVGAIVKVEKQKGC